MSRLLPLLGVAAFIGVGFIWRSWLQSRRFGTSGIVLFRSGSWTQHIREAGLVLLVLVLLVEALAFAVTPDVLAPLNIAPPPARGPLVAVGTSLLFGGTLLMVIAQLNLGASWRIGIEQAARPGLVTSGFYRLCRNPIYLTLFIVLAGFTVLVPTWLSAAALLGAIIGIRRHVVDEESYLTRTYGDAYRTYARQVGRFLPGLGRLP
jgi:protein-S-isoprenylcysteine O-methyltransferase Ste14